MIKKIILSILLVMVCTPAWCANKYLHATGGTGNWSDATGTWRTTDQGATVAAAPTSSDVAIMTANAGARTLTIDGANAAQQLNCTGFTGTLESSNAANILTITTNITIPATTSFGATAFRLKAGTGTATINIVPTFPWNFEWGSTGTKTIAANTTIGGITYMSANPTINGNTWFAVGGAEATTAANKIWYGSTNLEIQGGRYYYITKRTGGVLILNGNVTLESGYATSTMGIYDSTLRYTAGTITVATDSIFNINGTSTIESNVGSNVIFQHLDMTGTVTINSDIYVAKKISVIGTTSVTINGAYTIHFGYGGSSNADLIMYNLGTFISTTAKLSFEGSSGTLFSGTSYNGMVLQPLSALQIDVDINSPGTATFNNGSNNQFGGGRTMTHVAGAYTVSGCTWYVSTGGYTFNVNNAVTIPTFQNNTTATFPTAFTATTMTLNTGSTTNAIGNITATTLRMDGSAVLVKTNDATVVNVTTNFYQNGTGSLTPCIVASPINLTDFVTSSPLTMSNDGGSGPGYRRLTTTTTGALAAFTIAFDIVYAGATAYTTLSATGSYLWLPSGYTRYYYFIGASDAYWFSHGMTIGQRYRIVIMKAAGGDMVFYVNNVQKTNNYQGSLANLRAGSIAITSISNEAIGDVVVLNVKKDFAWVAADYAKFQSGGSSTNGQYDASEPDILAGWHVDQYTNDVTGLNFKYDGTLLNERSSYGEFRYVNASTSAVPIRTMFGSVVSSNNVYANTLPDIGGAGVSVTYY